SHARGIRKHAALSDRAGNGHALAVGEPVAERVGARSNRGACAQRALDRRESEERRSAGRKDAGSTGEDRSAVAVSGEASQCESASGFDGDPGASRAGAITDGADQHGAGAGQVLRGATARLQPAECESGESPGAESGTAGGDRGAQRTDSGIQPADREDRQGKLSASGATGTGEGSGHADRADVLADAGRSASVSQEPRRGLLRGTATGTAELGTERAADAHQQGR